MTTTEDASQAAVLAASQALSGVGAKPLPKLQPLPAEKVSAAADSAAGPAEPDVIKLFFVRLQRPAGEDGAIKKLHENFNAHVEQVRAINARLGAKREAIRALKNQMSEARSVKGSSQPEYDEKLNRIKALREERNAVQARIAEVRGHVKGLDVKTEAELDSRIKQEEERIRFGGVTLREEKQVLAELAKLRGQRDRIRQYEQSKGSLAGLEAELAKIKASLDELDGEFNMVKTERDAVAKVMTGLQAKLKTMEQELETELAQQKAIVEKKDVALAKLEAAKEEREAGQVDYRENRKFSLHVRELLDRGELEEARKLCEEQTNEWMGRLSKDTVAWAEYCDAVAHQRKSLVSDLLPNSSVAVMELATKAKTQAEAAAAPAAKAAVPGAAAKVAGGAKAGAAKGATAAPAPEVKAAPVADGAGKAKDLINAIMNQAKVEAQRIKASADAESELGSEGPSEDASAGDLKEKEQAKPAAAAASFAKPAAAAAASAKFVENPAQKAAQVFGFNMVAPEVREVEVLPLPPKAEQQVKSKAEVVEEQRIKAAEAEARKKKRQDTNDKKRIKAGDAQKKAALEAKAREAQAAKEALEQQQAALAKAAEPVVAEVEQPVEDVPAPAAVVEKTLAKPVDKAPTAVAKLVAPAAKRPAAKASVLRQVKKLCQEYQGPLVVVAFFMLLLAMLMFAS